MSMEIWAPGRDPLQPGARPEGDASRPDPERARRGLKQGREFRHEGLVGSAGDSVKAAPFLEGNYLWAGF